MLKKYFRELSVAFALGVLLLALAVFAPSFYQPPPVLSLATHEAPTLVVACGMALVIICRQIDISVGSMFAVCSVCAGLLATMHWPLALVIAASVLIGAIMGAFAEGARLGGIRPRLTTFFVFVFIGALVGLAAMMNAVQSPQVDPQSGTGLELKVIAAVVGGGGAISGGRGNLWGVFAGLLLLACVSPALTHLHVEAYWEKAIQGAIILLAVVADGLRSRKQRN